MTLVLSFLYFCDVQRLSIRHPRGQLATHRYTVQSRAKKQCNVNQFLILSSICGNILKITYAAKMEKVNMEDIIEGFFFFFTIYVKIRIYFSRFKKI